ncbi:MAG: hypothetical protein WCJ21_12350, partial [Planctomycetota bacterium]
HKNTPSPQRCSTGKMGRDGPSVVSPAENGSPEGQDHSSLSFYQPVPGRLQTICHPLARGE